MEVKNVLTKKRLALITIIVRKTGLTLLVLKTNDVGATYVR